MYLCHRFSKLFIWWQVNFWSCLFYELSTLFSCGGWGVGGGMAGHIYCNGRKPPHFGFDYSRICTEDAQAQNLHCLLYMTVTVHCLQWMIVTVNCLLWMIVTVHYLLWMIVTVVYCAWLSFIVYCARLSLFIVYCARLSLFIAYCCACFLLLIVYCKWLLFIAYHKWL